MTRSLNSAAAAGVALLAGACTEQPRSLLDRLMPGAAQVRTDDLLAVDRAFAARAKEAGVAAAFRDFMADDGKLLGAADDPVVGSESIYAVMSTLPADAEFDWAPREAVISKSGELGVTWGEYRLVVPGEDGAGVEETGRYLTVWRKDARGRWRGVLDIGT